MVPYSNFSTALSSHRYIKQTKLISEPEPNTHRLLTVVLFKPRFNPFFVHIHFHDLSKLRAKTLTRILLVHKVLFLWFLVLKRHS